MILQGWSRRTVQKILQARRFIQQHRGEKAANESHFANLGSLLLVGRGASSTQQWNWKRKARRNSRAVALGQEGKSSLTSLITTLWGAGWEQVVTPYLPYSTSPHPRSWLTLPWKGRNPRKAGNELGEGQVRKNQVGRAKRPTRGWAEGTSFNFASTDFNSSESQGLLNWDS